MRLAREGAKVLLADRARFPRDKPCGGGLTGRAVRELPVDVTPVVEDVVRRFEVRLRYRKRFERRSEEPLVLMTQRRRLDAFLTEQAAAAGADFRDGVTVGGLTVGPDGAELAVGGRSPGVSLVGADGVNGAIARSAGLGAGSSTGSRSRATGRCAREQRGRATVELGVVPGGYGWVFPKDGHANYGVGGWASEGPRLREHLRRLCEVHGVDVARSPTCRAAGSRSGGRARPAGGRSSSSATPPGSSIRCRGTGSTRRCSPLVSPLRRSWRRGSTTTSGSSTPRSAAMPRRRGRRSSCSTVTRGPPSRSRASRGCGT